MMIAKKCVGFMLLVHCVGRTASTWLTLPNGPNTADRMVGLVLLGIKMDSPYMSMYVPSVRCVFAREFLTLTTCITSLQASHCWGTPA